MTFTRFVATVLSVVLTAHQRVLCLVAFDGIDPIDLDPADRAVAFQLFGAVDRFPSHVRGVLVIVAGARSGKTYLSALYSLWRALTASLTSLAPGELAVALAVAPDMRLGRQWLRFALGAAKATASIASLIVGETSDGFTLRRPDGAFVSIETLPATHGGAALRGRSLVSAVLEEAAFQRDAEFAVNADANFRAVAPRVIAGGMTIVSSTPWAESGLLFDEFTRNFGTPMTAMAAHAPTVLMNPSKADEVARESERDAENARREFGAEFLSVGSGLFFDNASITRALDLGDMLASAAPAGGF